MFTIDVKTDWLSKLVKLKGVRLESAEADADSMLMGDCLLPLQWSAAMVGQVASSGNTDRVSWGATGRQERWREERGGGHSLQLGS